MEQFNLDAWLQDKSRKICTRDGRPVRIICTDRKARSGNIVGLVGEDESLIYVWNSNGIHIVSCIEENDLFFADEEEETIDDTEMNSLAYLTELGYTCIPPKKEEELTEFERELEMMMVSFSNGNLGSDVIKEMPKQKLHDYAHRLLDFARKENLKDLPKWKKATEHKEFAVHVCVMDEDMYPYLDTEVNEGDYYIELSDLKTLPKEE